MLFCHKKFLRNVKIDRFFFWFYLLKVGFPQHFLPCTNLASSCTWKFGMRTWSWSRPNLIIENWVWIQMYPKSKFRFFSHFLTNRVWSNQPKIYKWIMFKTLLCKKHHLKGMYDIPYERFWTMYVYSNKQNDEIINFNGQLWF